MAARLDATERALGPNTDPLRVTKRQSEARATAVAVAAAALVPAAARAAAAAAAASGDSRSSGRDGGGGDWGGGIVGLVGVIDLDDQLSTGMQTAVGDSEPGALLAVENEEQRGVVVEQQRVQLWQPQAATRGG